MYVTIKRQKKYLSHKKCGEKYKTSENLYDGTMNIYFLNAN